MATPKKKPTTAQETTAAPKVNTVPDFAIIQGTIYRASAIDALEVHQKEDLSVTFAMSGRIITISFQDPKDAVESHRLIAYLMTGTDLYASNSDDSTSDAE